VCAACTAEGALAEGAELALADGAIAVTLAEGGAAPASGFKQAIENIEANTKETAHACLCMA
jgi:hypothetical protein